MRRGLLIATITLAALACSGIERGAFHERGTPADAADIAGEPGEDPGGPDAYADEGPRHDAPPGDDVAGPDDAAASEDGVIEDEGLDLSRETLPADADIPDVETPDTEVPPGTLRHLGWFGPGGVVAGNGMSGLGSLSGPQQAWQVQ